MVIQTKTQRYSLLDPSNPIYNINFYYKNIFLNILYLMKYNILYLIKLPSVIAFYTILNKKSNNIEFNFLTYNHIFQVYEMIINGIKSSIFTLKFRYYKSYINS